ncbi:unnamed protein product [Lactuca virosa]|uniref:Uncharacterized protein n=1 Tax=Lactuca virosa TaxID=75947 RepID=A0AAU9MMS7_9ASTR|nr:unnamed protein product [Lactuca virosa]
MDEGIHNNESTVISTIETSTIDTTTVETSTITSSTALPPPSSPIPTYVPVSTEASILSVESKLIRFSRTKNLDCKLLQIVFTSEMMKGFAIILKPLLLNFLSFVMF